MVVYPSFRKMPSTCVRTVDELISQFARHFLVAFAEVAQDRRLAFRQQQLVGLCRRFGRRSSGARAGPCKTRHAQGRVDMGLGGDAHHSGVGTNKPHRVSDGLSQRRNVNPA